MSDFLRSAALLLALLNPFLVIIYLLDVVRKRDLRSFAAVLVQGAIYAGVVFCCFAVLGEWIFANVVQAEFASFQIFGGLVFVAIAMQFVFRGPMAIEMLRGDSEHLASAIAMPVLIGPGTVSACVVIGQRLSPLLACGAVVLAVAVSVLVMVLLKLVHDRVRTSHEVLVERYIEIVGRVMALYVGTVAIELIMQGLVTWSKRFR